MSDAGYRAARAAAALFDLSGHAKIAAVGRDALVFLHNFATNDIKGLAPGRGCETFFCTATAKVIAHGLVWRRAPEGKRERLEIDLTPGQQERLLTHLRRYIISEDVQLTDQTHDQAQYHLVGPQAAQTLIGAGIDPGEDGTGLTFRTEGVLSIRHTHWLGVPGIDLVMPREQASALMEQLVQAGATPGSAEAWEVLRIEGGVPRYGIDLDESTFAPEVNRTGQAISYTKGCYLGQEPIVMARDRGVVQRGLVGLLLGDDPVPHGSLLYQGEKEVGRVTSSTRSPQLGHAIALAYVRRGANQPGTEVEVATPTGRQPARISAVPFVSPAEGETQA